MNTPFSVMVGTGTTHCGAGCTLVTLSPNGWLFPCPPSRSGSAGSRSSPRRCSPIWILDFIFAFGFGIVFSVFSIAPYARSRISRRDLAALKADTLSLAAWQAGMYAFMAFAQLYLFGHILGRAGRR